MAVRAGAPAGWAEELPLEATVRYEQGGYRLTVRRGYCKGCGLCVQACPARILHLDHDGAVSVSDIGRCVFCGVCSGRCPDFVFVLERPSREG